MTRLIWARAHTDQILTFKQWLTPRELARAQGRRHPEPHLAAQLLGRALLARFLGKALAEVTLERNAQGAPINPFAQVSLSHSGLYVAAVVANQGVGIDLEVPKARSRAALAAELGWPQRHFYDYWCAAEAALKYWRRPVWDIRELEVRPVGEGAFTVQAPGTEPVPIRLHRQQGIGCALAGIDQMTAPEPLERLF